DRRQRAPVARAHRRGGAELTALRPRHGAAAPTMCAPFPQDHEPMNASPGHAAANFRQEELARFAALANRWWDPDGPQKPLHALHPGRLRYVTDRVRLAGAPAAAVGGAGGPLSQALAE